MLSIRAVYFDLPIVNTPGQVAIGDREHCAGKWQSKLIKGTARVASLG